MTETASNSAAGRDAFIKVTDHLTGKVTATSHRVWDIDRFMQSQQKQYRDADAKDGTAGRHKVEMIDAKQYREIQEGNHDCRSNH